MHALIVLVGIFGCVTAQIITQSGCTCKSFTQVQWRLSGGAMGGGFSHNGCSTGPYEDKSPGNGRSWCDTQESSCSNGEGWDLCTPPPAAKPTPRPFKGIAEAVNVNMGANPNAGPPGVSLNVNVNVGGSDASMPIKTVQGCTCHATSEVILTQNGVRVGGGFSHTGCGTGPYEANSPGHGSPWCDTVETWCAAGWDLCIPPNPVNQARQSSYTPPLPPLPPPNSYATNSFTAYSGAGMFQPAFPPTPYFVPPTPQPWVPSYQPPAFQPPAVQPPAYQPPVTPTILTPVPVAKVVSSQPRSPFTSQKGLVSARLAPHKVRRGPPRGGGSDYDYDESSSKSSSSALLPWMLMNGASSTTSSSTSSSGSSSSGSTSSTTSSMASLLPFMLASRGGSTSGSGSSSSMLPMMMMMSGSGGMNSNSMLSQFAMLNAFREGDGEAQNATGLGDIGQGLGFTRAVVSKTAAASAAAGSGDSTDGSVAEDSSQSVEQNEIADGSTGNTD